MINVHNYEVGRRIFKVATDITCSCQGLCSSNKCWRHLSPFKEITDELMRRYERATHVQPSASSNNKRGDPKAPVKLRPVKRGVRKPRKKDLVFIDESPDFCNQDSRLGILGTKDRHCNSTSNGLDGCDWLCCRRGYQTTVVVEERDDCDCKFVWCCEVKCQKCSKQVEYEVCN